MRIRKRMDSAILFSVKGKNKYKLLKLECLFCTLFSHSAIIAGEKKYGGILQCRFVVLLNEVQNTNPPAISPDHRAAGQRFQGRQPVPDPSGRHRLR